MDNFFHFEYDSWCIAVLCSRAYGKKQYNCNLKESNASFRDKKEIFLVPLADMFNHKSRDSPEDRVVDYEWDGHNFDLITYESHKKGNF